MPIKNINMKNLLIAAALFFTYSYAKAQPGSNPEAEKAMMEYMAPGEMHKWMASMAGEWTTSTTFWMQPGAQPMTAKGASSNEMMMDGRFLKMTQTGDFMGMPFQGMGIIGYDNALKMFVNSWIDNMGTGMMNGKGTANVKNKTIEIKGSMMQPMQKQETPYREVFTITDDKNMMLEMFTDAGDKEFKCMEVKYMKK